MRLMAILAVLCGVAFGGAAPQQVVTVNGVQFKLGKKVVPFEAIEFHDVTLYEATCVGTGEECAIVTGYLVNNLQDHLYTVRVKVGIWALDVGGCEAPTSADVTVSAPQPKKRTRFVAVAMVPRGRACGFNITYSLERLSVRDHVGPQAAKQRQEP